MVRVVVVNKKNSRSYLNLILCSTLIFFIDYHYPKHCPSLVLVVVASEAVAAEGAKALIIINRTLKFFPAARAAFTGKKSLAKG